MFVILHMPITNKEIESKKTQLILELTVTLLYMENFTCVPMPAISPIVSSQAQHHDANGPHLGPAKWAAQK